MGDTPEGEGGGPMEKVEGVKKKNKGDGFLCQSGNADRGLSAQFQSCFL